MTSILDLTIILSTKYVNNSKDSKVEIISAWMIKAIKVKRNSKLAKYLELETIMKMIIVAPVFFFHIVFRVTSAAVLLLFFRSFSLVILAIYSILLKKILIIFGNDNKMKDGREFKHQLVESIYLREPSKN